MVYFHLFAIVNNDAIHICICVSCEAIFSFLLGLSLEVIVCLSFISVAVIINPAPNHLGK